MGQLADDLITEIPIKDVITVLMRENGDDLETAITWFCTKAIFANPPLFFRYTFREELNNRILEIR